MLTVELADVARTHTLGVAIGRLIPAGTVLHLAGTLGAGKTCLVQGLAEGLGIPSSAGVRSPSFAIVRTHEQGRVPLVHVDLYRLDEIDELIDLGLEEWLDGTAVLAVEWADRFADGLSSPDVLIELRYGDGGGRTAILTTRADVPWLDQALTACGPR